MPVSHRQSAPKPVTVQTIIIETEQNKASVRKQKSAKTKSDS